MKMKILPSSKDVLKRAPWYVLVLIMISIYLYIISVSSPTNNKITDLAVATLSVLIGVGISAVLILWQRHLNKTDLTNERYNRLKNLMPTLKIETGVNIMQLNNLKKFLTHNTQSYEAVWGRIIAITNQFQDSGHQAIRDAGLFGELGDLAKSELVSYARLNQVRGIAEEGIAICNYDSQIKNHDKQAGNEQLGVLATIMDVCLAEMTLLNGLLDTNSQLSE